MIACHWSTTLLGASRTERTGISTWPSKSSATTLDREVVSERRPQAHALLVKALEEDVRGGARGQRLLTTDERRGIPARVQGLLDDLCGVSGGIMQ